MGKLETSCQNCFLYGGMEIFLYGNASANLIIDCCFAVYLDYICVKYILVCHTRPREQTTKTYKK